MKPESSEFQPGFTEDLLTANMESRRGSDPPEGHTSLRDLCFYHEHVDNLDPQCEKTGWSWEAVLGYSTREDRMAVRF